ncbi:nuclear transport factor 2 family protein [Stappia sp. BW2]|uniref:nuclear transport factor 2 family protein n=1 Tax=Stappia sp. BW2 TaxID=2592622 RepID=UPI0011DEE2F8|nr:nuclear transport factor 2 family protein [Stappia sp. BW2]TYC67252.1 nuclear transport factor 2 family protein [Stappia sp. BW2]
MTLEETIDIYCAAWSERDPSRRQDLLGRSVTDGIRYTDPGTDVVGIAALVDHISGVLSKSAGAKIVRTSGIDTHHGAARFAWQMVKADGTTLPEGLDVVWINEETGKLKTVLGFFGALRQE